MILLSNGVILHNTLNETDVYPLMKQCREGGLLVEVASFSRWDVFVVFRVAKEVFIITQTIQTDEELIPIFQNIYDKYFWKWEKVFPRNYQTMGDILRGVIFSITMGFKPEPLAWAPKNLLDSTFFDFSEVSMVLLAGEMGDSYGGALFQRPFLKHGYLGLFFLFGISDPKSTNVQHPSGFTILIEYTNRLIIYELFPQIESICHRYAQDFRQCWQNKKNCQNMLKEMYKLLSSIPLRSPLVNENIKNMMINSVQELNHIQKSPVPLKVEEEDAENYYLAQIRKTSSLSPEETVAVNASPVNSQNRLKTAFSKLYLMRFKNWHLQQKIVKDFNNLHQPHALTKGIMSILRSFAFEPLDKVEEKERRARITRFKFAIDRVQKILVGLHHFSEEDLRNYWGAILEEYIDILPKISPFTHSQIETVFAPIFSPGVFPLFCYCAIYRIIGSSKKVRPYSEKLSIFLKDLPEQINPPSLEEILNHPTFKQQIFIISLPETLQSISNLSARWDTYVLNLKALAKILNTRKDFMHKTQGQEIKFEDLETSFRTIVKDQTFKTILTRLNACHLLLKPIDFTNTGIIITRNSYLDVPRWVTLALTIGGSCATISFFIYRMVTGRF